MFTGAGGEAALRSIAIALTFKPRYERQGSFEPDSGLEGGSLLDGAL